MVNEYRGVPAVEVQMTKAAALVEVNEGRYQPVVQMRGAVSDSRQFKAIVNKVTTCLAGKGGWEADQRLKAKTWERGTKDAEVQLWFETDDTRMAIRYEKHCDESLGRTWRVEFVVVKEADRLQMRCVVRVLVHRSGLRTVQPRLPKWLSKLAIQHPLANDGRMMHTAPWFVSTEEDAGQLRALIGSHERSQVVIVLTAENIKSAQGAAAERLAARVVGFAHVAVISHSLLSQPKVAELGPGAGGVRMYGKDKVWRSTSSVRLVMSPTEWGNGSSESIDIVVRMAARFTVYERDPEDEALSFSAVRADIQDGRAAQLKEAAYQAQQRIDELQSQLTKALELAAEEEKHKVLLDASQRALEHERWTLSSRVDFLEQSAAKTSRKEDCAVLSLRPSTWDELEWWLEDNFSERIHLTKQAWKAARASDFADLAYLADVLNLLGTSYWEIKAEGSEGARNRYLAECAALRIEISHVGTAASDRRHAKQYETIWDDKRYLCDMHVSGSSSRDKQRGLRIYFAYDTELRTIVIGSLPDHLRNRHS